MPKWLIGILLVIAGLLVLSWFASFITFIGKILLVAVVLVIIWEVYHKVSSRSS